MNGSDAHVIVREEVVAETSDRDVIGLQEDADP